MLLNLLSDAWRPFARSRPLARWLFGVDFLSGQPNDRYFDVTTPLLVRAAARGLSERSRALDMGTGAFATIGLGIWRRTGCHVVSSDIHPRILEQARENVALNRAPIRVVRSRFFDDLDEDFDVVTFNPPYVPSELAQNPNWQRPFDFQSDGGPDGTDVIAEFFDAFAAKGRGATGFLGMNELLVSTQKVLALLAARPGLVHLRSERLFPRFPFYVLVFRRAVA